MRFKIKKSSGWVVKNQRPEELLGDPGLHYNDEEIERYSRSSGVRKAQEKIADRITGLLDIPQDSSFLDLGSGPGITAEFYRSCGYKVTCLDVLPKMLEKAKSKGFECVEGDMRSLQKIFPKRKFDAVVSASAVQWLKDQEDLEDLAKGIHHILKRNSQCVLQFYPKSEEELKRIIRIFKQNGFSGDATIDYPKDPRKKTIFLVFRKIG